MKDGLRVRMPPHYTEHQAGHKDHREMHRLAAAVLAVLLLLIPVVST
jgi:LmbE family N-acetylglucosaminyl deacetylase